MYILVFIICPNGDQIGIWSLKELDFNPSLIN